MFNANDWARQNQWGLYVARQQQRYVISFKRRTCAEQKKALKIPDLSSLKDTKKELFLVNTAK